MQAADQCGQDCKKKPPPALIAHAALQRPAERMPRICFGRLCMHVLLWVVLALAHDLVITDAPAIKPKPREDKQVE